MRIIPAPLFSRLMRKKLLSPDQLLSSGDGFQMAVRPLSAMLEDAGIHTFPGSRGQTLECRNFFDDWYLYSVEDHDRFVYSLFKMREQEFDLMQGLEADGDTPGVTVSFIAFEEETLLRCLESGDPARRKALADEINRVVAWPKQRHHDALKAYFIRPEARAPYLIARRYVRFIASQAENGLIDVPLHYRKLYSQHQSARRNGRIPEFICRCNASAGYEICDHARILIRDAAALTPCEELIILATHTGNTSFHSFAAEVRYHARFLISPARIPLPLIGSPYASAIRADMSIQDGEFQGPRPYYRPDSRLMRQQMLCHPTLPEPENDFAIGEVE